MQDLIKKINELQDVCSNYNLKKLQLPQIIVVGSQSAGKSSVLENIVGKDFLPRGAGIVTRRPLIIQLYNSEKTVVSFNHISNKEFTDLGEVKRELLQETIRVLKNKNDVSNIPITLKFYSPNVPNLTLIDLPGLVRVPTNNQPRDIVTKIYEMCKEYAKNPNAIILAVSAANSDIANSDALQLAREVDPEYERTIGVLTKIDAMDPGTDVIDVLAGRIIKLKLGFVPVVNRSQLETESNLPIEVALSQEKQFFLNHNAYKKNSHFCGTQYLILRLHTLLQQHIKLCLPDLQSDINSQLLESQKELNSLGIPTDPKDCVLRTIGDFCDRFSEQLSGIAMTDGLEIQGGARLTYALHSHFSNFLDTLDPLAGMTDAQIRTIILNCNGASGIQLYTHSAFERLVQNSIATLKPHSLKIVAISFDEMVKIAEKSSDQRHPLLNQKILNTILSLLQENSDETQKMIERFMDWNISYISTAGHEGIRREDLLKDLSNSKEKIDFYKLNEKPSLLDLLPKILRIRDQTESKEVILAKNMVISYFNLMKKIIIDQVPKAIMTELVFKTKRQMRDILLKEVYESPDLDLLVMESEEVKNKRKNLNTKVKALNEAKKVISSCNL